MSPTGLTTQQPVLADRSGRAVRTSNRLLGREYLLPKALRRGDASHPARSDATRTIDRRERRSDLAPTVVIATRESSRCWWRRIWTCWYLTNDLKLQHTLLIVVEWPVRSSKLRAPGLRRAGHRDDHGRDGREGRSRMRPGTIGFGRRLLRRSNVPAAEQLPRGDDGLGLSFKSFGRGGLEPCE